MKRSILIPTAVAAVTIAALAAGLALGASVATPSTTVATGRSSFGRILVDSKGRTLYLFEKDGRGRSACAGTCAAYWPPLLTRAKPTAVRGASASLLGTIRRADGTTQVTYAGHPLYRYLPDTKPGQTNGQDSHDFGAGWYVLSPAGKKIETAGAVGNVTRVGRLYPSRYYAR